MPVAANLLVFCFKMSTKANKLNTIKVSDSNLIKLSKKYSKKPVVSSQTSLEKVPEKELQLTKEVSIRCINRKELFFENAHCSPPTNNMSHIFPDKSIMSDGTVISENGFLQFEGKGAGDSTSLYGKDWDEMEFLGSSDSTKNYNTLSDSIRTTSEALNGNYARTRKNLGKRISADKIANGLNNKTSMQSSKTKDKHPSYIAKSNNAALGKLNKQSSVLNSPSASITPHKALSSFNKAGTSKEVRPSLLEMVKKFSASANVVQSDSSASKASFPKSSTAFKNYMNKLRSEPPRARSVTNVSLQSLVPESIEISLVPNTSKSPLKKGNSSHVKDNKLEKSTVSKLLVSNSKQVEKDCQAIKVKQSTEKRSSEPVGNAEKKSKSVKREKTKSTNETIYNPSLKNSNVTNVAETDISDKEISSWLDEEMIKGAEELQIKESPNINPIPQVFAVDSGVENGNLMNPTPTSYIFTPTLPNTLNNACVPSGVNNNLIYDVNSFSLYPPVAAPPPPSTTVFILPVSSNFSTVPNTPGHMNSLPPSQPIVKVSCNGMDPDSVFKSICKTFYQSTGTGIQNSDSANAIYPETSNSIFQTNSIVQTSVTASSGTSSQQPGTSGNNSSIPKESDVNEVSTADRGSLVLSYFCELMKNSPKCPLEEYKREAKRVLDILSSFPHYLSVKYFHSIAEEYFSDFCFCDSSSLCTRFTFGENLEESRLNEILKQYVSFQVKEIVKSSPSEPFCVKSNFIFKARNSKLTYFEKLILKKMLKGNQSVDLEELISRLFFVGLVVVFNVLKKQNEE